MPNHKPRRNPICADWKTEVENENAFLGRAAVYRPKHQPREGGSEGDAVAFRKDSQLVQSPVPLSTQDEGQSMEPDARDTPKGRETLPARQARRD